jgi:hypothetical protein
MSLSQATTAIADSCNPVLPCHIPAGQVSACERCAGGETKETPQQGSKENKPLQNLAIQPGPGKQGDGNVWKRKGLKGVLSDV